MNAIQTFIPILWAVVGCILAVAAFELWEDRCKYGLHAKGEPFRARTQDKNGNWGPWRTYEHCKRCGHLEETGK